MVIGGLVFSICVHQSFRAGPVLGGTEAYDDERETTSKGTVSESKGPF